MGEEAELRSETNESNKRKLEEGIELAKQKAQEIAARLNSVAESKRPRLETTHSSEPVFYSNPLSRTPPPDGVSKFSSQPTGNAQVGSVPFSSQPVQYYGFQGSSKKISIPNGKVGVIIGKAGETIKYLQQQSGAKIQITKDSEADPYSLTRDVELTGTTEQISRAEGLINDVIAETDAGGSAPSANRGFSSAQPGSEQIVVQVPNNKVALLIGKGGETIKTIQSRSGARMQIIPLHLPPGDTSTERSVYINGLKEQIDAAKELVDEVIRENRLRNPPVPSAYTQPVYTPPGNWATPAQSSLQQQQQPGYGYMVPGTYPTPAPYYGGYSTQQAGWDQSNPSSMPPPPQQSGGYSYPAQPDQTGSAPPNLSYSYSQVPPITSQNYNQGYSQQPLPSYGQGIPNQAPPPDQQNPYATSGYGPPAPSSQPGGATTPQSSQPLPVYPYAYSQPVAIPQAAYGTSQSYVGPPLAQPGQDQTGSTQTGYGMQQPAQAPSIAAPPMYGQAGYPPPPAPATSNYLQGINPPVYGQPPVQPLTQPQQPPAMHGSSQPLGHGAESNGDGNSASGYGPPPVAQEPVRSQS